MLKKRNGVYYWERRVNGVRYRRSTKCTNREDAKVLADRWESAALTGRKPTRTLTFNVFADEYVESVSARKKAPQRDADILRHARKFFGHKVLDQITRLDCERYMSKRAESKAANGTINRERTLLCAMFYVAIDSRYLSINPWRGVAPLKVHPRDRVLTEEEEAKLMAVMSPEYQRFLQVALGTGLRAGELLALTPQHIHAEDRYIHVTWNGAKGEKERDVPVSPATLAILVEQSRGCTDTDPLWPVTDWAVLKYLFKSCDRALIPRTNIHALRHTFATRAAQMGMQPQFLQAILGHHSVNVTMGYYVHLRREHIQAAVDRLTQANKDAQEARAEKAPTSPVVLENTQPPQRLM